MAKPGRICSICADPAVAFQVDARIAAGDCSLAQIATQLNLSKYAISRHSRHAVSKLSDAAVEKLADNKLDMLFDRCESLYSALAQNGDIRQASEILKVQTRLAQTLAEREETKQEAESVDPHDPEKTITVEQFDTNKNKVLAAYAQWREKWGWVTCPVCEHNRPIDPRIIPAKIKAYLETSNVNSSATN